MLTAGKEVNDESSMLYIRAVETNIYGRSDLLRSLALFR